MEVLGRRMRHEISMLGVWKCDTSTSDFEGCKVYGEYNHSPGYPVKKSQRDCVVHEIEIKLHFEVKRVENAPILFVGSPIRRMNESELSILASIRR